MKYSDKIEFMLENNQLNLSKLILEKDEEESSNEVSFDMPDPEGDEEDNETEEEGGGDEGALDSESQEDDLTTDDNLSADENKQIDDKAIKDLSSKIDKIFDMLNQDSLTWEVEGTIRNYLSESFSYSRSSIKDFLIKEDKDLKKVEDDIDTLQNILSKGSQLVDQFNSPKEVDIKKYVNAAINAYRNFDNLFSKENIVKQAAINVLVLDSGAKAEQNVKDFEELFHEELSKIFGIDYPEYALVNVKQNVATGAVKQG